MRLYPIAGPSVPKTGMRTEKVKVYRVIDQTMEVSGTEKVSFSVGSARDTILFPRVPIKVPMSSTARSDQGGAGFFRSCYLSPSKLTIVSSPHPERELPHLLPIRQYERYQNPEPARPTKFQ